MTITQDGDFSKWDWGEISSILRSSYPHRIGPCWITVNGIHHCIGGGPDPYHSVFVPSSSSSSMLSIPDSHHLPDASTMRMGAMVNGFKKHRHHSQLEMHRHVLWTIDICMHLFPHSLSLSIYSHAFDLVIMLVSFLPFTVISLVV
jgi:hypothetical protein